MFMRFGITNVIDALATVASVNQMILRWIDGLTKWILKTLAASLWNSSLTAWPGIILSSWTFRVISLPLHWQITIFNPELCHFIACLLIWSDLIHDYICSYFRSGINTSAYLRSLEVKFSLFHSVTCSALHLYQSGPRKKSYQSHHFPDKPTKENKSPHFSEDRWKEEDFQGGKTRGGWRHKATILQRISQCIL